MKNITNTLTLWKKDCDMSNKECKGCITYIEPSFDTRCGHNSIPNGKVCPCIECLVKPICDTPCDLFGSLYTTTIRSDMIEGDES